MFGIELNRWNGTEQLFECYPRDVGREVSPSADMLAHSECQVRARRAVQHVDLRLLELRLVAVGRPVGEQHVLSLAQRYTADIEIAEGAPSNRGPDR